MMQPYTSERGIVMGVNIDRSNIKFKFYLLSDQPHLDNDSYNPLADLNEDNQINVVDVVNLVNLILSGTVCLDYTNCICDYIPEENTSADCSIETNYPYVVGDQLSCEDIEVEFSFCYPDCDETFSLSDYTGRIFLIIYEQDW